MMMNCMKHTIYLLLCCLALHAQALRAQDPVFAFSEGLQVTAGETFEVNLSVNTDLSPHNVLAYSLAFTYNANMLQIKEVQYDAKLEGFSNINNTLQAGKVTLTGASTSKIEGSGTLITLTLEALTAGSAALNFIVNECVLNEGVPTASFQNGSISIASKPLITISPNTAFLAVGQTLQCNLSGSGTAPFSWGVTHPEVATVSESGLITALGHGTTRVFVEDATGLQDTTDGFIEITALSLSLPGDLQEWQGWEVDVPVNASGFDLLDVVSGQFSLSYRADVLQFLEARTNGTLLENCAVSAGEMPSGQLNLAFASTAALQAISDHLMVLRFKVLPGAAASTALNFSKVLFNEAIKAHTVNGSFGPKILPVLSISPASVTMVAGDTLTFTASNGHEPYIWDTSDHRVARVNEEGRLIAYEGGVTDLIVSDAVGATTTLKDIKVADMRVYFPTDTLERINSLTRTRCLVNAVPSARQAVSSIEGEIAVSNAHIKMLGIETEGSLTEGWQKIITPISDQRIRFYLAGPTPFRSKGTAFYVTMELTEGFREYDRSAILFHNLLLNEGAPIPETTDGSIEGKHFTDQDKSIYLGESTGELNVPETIIGTISKWQKRNRLPGQTVPWTDMAITTRQISDTPDELGEWEYNVVIDGASLKVANIMVLPLPDNPVSLGPDIYVHQDQSDPTFSIYPNPTSGQLCLDLTKVCKQLTVSIINIGGQCVAEKVFYNQSSVQFAIPGASGVYFIAINADNRHAVLKAIKKQ